MLFIPVMDKLNFQRNLKSQQKKKKKMKFRSRTKKVHRLIEKVSTPFLIQNIKLIRSV